MSSVMDITIRGESGANIRAVLKLYDRRFGCDLRQISGKHAPHTSADEVAFQDFVRQGLMTSFLEELQETKRTSLILPQPYYVLGDPPYTPEDKAKFEAALWQECDEYFSCETEVYSRLEDLQGKSIPRLYAHVRLVSRDSDAPRELLQPQMARYFDVKGILVELIPGYNLWDLATSPLAPQDRGTWPALVQSAADAAHHINMRDVIMNDCAPRNVMVKKGEPQTPFIIDFAQCCFKDKWIKRWEDIGLGDEDSEDEEEWNPDVEYCERLRDSSNPAAIGAVMTTRVLRATGMKLDIKYPDYDMIIDGIKRGKTAR